MYAWLAVRREGEDEPTWFELDEDPTAQGACAAPACAGAVLAAADSLEATWQAAGRELREGETGAGARPPELERKLRALGY